MWVLLLAALQLDSLAARRAAQAAQAEFERFRINHLPRVYAGSRNRCDEIVGRFCFWHDRDEDSWEPPSEPPQIRAARERLIQVLDSLGRLFPGDQWIVGQRVRYLVEHGNRQGALEAARSCSGQSWWCSALLGYALHASQRFEAAESAFARALAGMPEEQRCQWDDLSPLLDGSLGGYTELSCRDRRSLERRIWWLSDPLYSIPGNERLTEHYSRRVLDRLQERSRSAYGLSWGSDLRELLLRYGWPVAWARDESVSRLDGSPPVIVAYNPPRGRRFIPPLRSAIDWSRSAPEDWNLKPEFPRSTYAVPYATRLEPLEVQLAAFRRGDSSVIVAAYEIAASELSREEPRTSGTRYSAPGIADQGSMEATLVIASDPDDRPLVVRGAVQGSRGVLAGVSRHRKVLASVEVLWRRDSVVAYRARRWIAAPEATRGIALSEPLLFHAESEDPLAGSLEEVLPSVLGAPLAQPGTEIGVFWEIYPQRSGPAELSLAVVRRGGLLTRIASRLGLGKEQRELMRIAWSEALIAPGPLPRAIRLGLPYAPEGEYLLTIQITTADGATNSSQRRFRLSER